MNIEVIYGLPFVEVTICYQIGEMNYGMEIDGILGFDFIQAADLVIDFKELTLEAGD